jgi:histidine phosphotransferase ChpT
MEARGDPVFLRLLVSHICHELVSAVGAIGNGVELLEEEETGLDAEALGLISQSSKTAAAKLRLMRVVYGSAGMSADFRLADARRALADLYGIEAKLTLDWPDAGPLDLAPGGVQLATAMVLLAGNCLPRGGVIGVAFLHGKGGVELTATAAGIGPRFNDELSEALRGQGVPDHRTIHAHYCAWAAANLGTFVTGDASGDTVRLSALLPFPAEG